VSLITNPQPYNSLNLNFNEICNFKMEINKLVEENIYLKTQLIDIRDKINQYDNIIERTDLKYQEQINNFQKQILKYNNYIHEIYIFFNNITKNYFPELNFSLQSNETILISFELFKNKLNLIEKYICELNKSLGKSNNLFNKRNITEVSPDNLALKNNYYLTEFNMNKTLEDRINNIEKHIINKAYYNKINKKSIPLGKNKNKYINNSLISKYHYGNISIKGNSTKKHKKISNNIIKNYDRFKYSFGKRDNSSNKKSSSELNSNNNYFYKNSDIKFLKKSLPVKQKRSLTPLANNKNLFRRI
jgi:hypothetical protein